MEGCEGCVFNQNNPYKHCVMIELSEFSKKCPCSVCLVKVNCTKVCELKSQYYCSYMGRNNIGAIRSM